MPGPLPMRVIGRADIPCTHLPREGWWEAILVGALWGPPVAQIFAFTGWGIRKTCVGVGC